MAGPWAAALPEPSYEEVAAKHWYPRQPRDSSEDGVPQLPYAEVGRHFVRSSLFLAPSSCWPGEPEVAERCCADDPGPGPRPRCNLNDLYTKTLCCGKERHQAELYLPGAAPFRVGNASLRRRPSDPQRSHCSCLPLRSMAGAPLLPWARALLQLPASRVAPCAAGCLFPRLSAAPVAEALAGLAELQRAAASACPGRRAILALRRGAMLWRHRARQTGALPKEAEGPYQQLLQTLELCRSRLADEAPVVQLHMPKTAGSSICFWAKASGMRIAYCSGSPCYLRGDGPLWLGQGAAPASCRQRAHEARKSNSTWMAVERWVDLPLCDGLRYAVALRSPLKRTQHHFSHLLHHFSTIFGGELTGVGLLDDFFGRLWRYEEVRSSIRGRPSPDVAMGGDWLDQWLGLASNYQVRSLAGAPAGHAYLEGTVAAAGRLRAAMAALEQFDVVLVVGEGKGPRGFVRPSQVELLQQLMPGGAAARGPVPSDLQPPDEQRPPKQRRTPRAPRPNTAVGMPAEQGSPTRPRRRARARPFPEERHTQGGLSLPVFFDYQWAPGEREELLLRNMADLRLVAHARLIERLDLEHARHFGR